jgi:hypothetical protein
MLQSVSECQRNEHHMSSFAFACFQNQFLAFKALHVHALKRAKLDESNVIGDEDLQLECLLYTV